jgi:hypothetical protein
MLDSQPIRLGISGSPNEDVIDRLLRQLSVPVRAYGVENLNATDFSEHDVLILLSPDPEEAKTDELVRALEGGLTALILIDADPGLTGRERYLAQRLGYEMQVSKADKIQLKYTEDYPVPAKRGHDHEMTYGSKRLWVTFKPLLSNFPPVRKTIVYRSSMLGKDPYAVLVQLGDGMAILCDTVTRREDRADMLSHLVANTKRRGSYRAAGWLEEAKAALPGAAASLFEVYEEIPIRLLAERAGLDMSKIDGYALMGVLEDLIREHRIAGRIRKDCLVKS